MAARTAKHIKCLETLVRAAVVLVVLLMPLLSEQMMAQGQDASPTTKLSMPAGVFASSVYMELMALVDAHQDVLTSVTGSSSDSVPRFAVLGLEAGRVLVPATVERSGVVFQIVFELRAHAKSEWQGLWDQLLGPVVDWKFPGGLVRALPSGKPTGPGKTVARVLSNHGLRIENADARDGFAWTELNIVTQRGLKVSSSNLRTVLGELQRSAPHMGPSGQFRWGSDIRLVSAPIVKK